MAGAPLVTSSDRVYQDRLERARKKQERLERARRVIAYSKQVAVQQEQPMGELSVVIRDASTLRSQESDDTLGELSLVPLSHTEWV